MTQNPVTEAVREADRLEPIARELIKVGIKFKTPMPVIAIMLPEMAKLFAIEIDAVPVVAVRSVLIADRDEFDDDVWDNYKVEL